MKQQESTNLRRRQFLISSPIMLIGAPFLKSFPLLQQSAPKGPDLPEELSPAEAEIVNNSTMAKDIANFFGKGYSCAESGLAVGLRHLKKSEDLIWMAGGFGGGLYHGDLCGFLTGSVMAIGLYAGGLQLERGEAHKVCNQKLNEFWTWWTSTAPLHCTEIREGHKDFKACHRLGRLGAAKVEGLFGTA